MNRTPILANSTSSPLLPTRLLIIFSLVTTLAIAAESPPAVGGKLLEAENAELLEGAQISPDPKSSFGHSVGWITRAGAGLRFPTTEGAAWLAIRHNGPGGDFSLHAGDKRVGSLTLPTGTWGGPWMETVVEAAIPAGVPVSLTLVKGGANLDCILLSLAKPVLPLALAPAPGNQERTADLVIEWGYEAGKDKLAYDGRIEATQNASVVKVVPLPGSTTTMTGPTTWTSAPASDQRRGIVATVRYRENHLTGTQRSILTVRTSSGSFSFVPTELDPLPVSLRMALKPGFFNPWNAPAALERARRGFPDGLDGSPIVAPEYGFYVCLAKDAVPAATYVQQLAAKKGSTIRQRVREHAEQSWEGAVRAMHGRLPQFPAPFVRPPCLIKDCACTAVGNLPEEREILPATRIQVPEAGLNELWRVGAWHLLRRAHRINRDDLPKVVEAGFATKDCRFVGHDDPQGMWILNNHPFVPLVIEFDRVVWGMDHLGMHREARDGVEMILATQQPDGLPNFKTGAGGHDIHRAGALLILWVMAEHHLLTRDKAWLTQQAPRLKKALDWLITRRHSTLTDKLSPAELEQIQAGRRSPPGLQPKAPMGDGDTGGSRYYFVCDAWSYQSISHMAQALADIDPALAATLRVELERYRKDLLPVIDESLVLSPVIRVGDGTSRSFLPQGFQDRGALSHCTDGERFAHCGIFSSDIVLTSAAIECWIRSGLLSPTDPRIDGHFQVLEDRFLSENPWLYKRKADYNRERDWFHHAGWGYQSGWERLCEYYLEADDIPNFLRSLFNHAATDLHLATWTFNEHTTWAEKDKAHGRAVFLSNVRNMLAMEHRDELWLARATPRAWLEQGKKISIKNASTHFGALSYEIVSDVDHGTITATLEMPARNAPSSVILRLRHPKTAPIKNVTINGKPWTAYHKEKETIEIKRLTGTVTVVAGY